MALPKRECYPKQVDLIVFVFITQNSHRWISAAPSFPPLFWTLVVRSTHISIQFQSLRLATVDRCCRGALSGLAAANRLNPAGLIWNHQSRGWSSLCKSTLYLDVAASRKYVRTGTRCRTSDGRGLPLLFFDSAFAGLSNRSIVAALISLSLSRTTTSRSCVHADPVHATGSVEAAEKSPTERSMPVALLHHTTAVGAGGEVRRPPLLVQHSQFRFGVVARRGDKLSYHPSLLVSVNRGLIAPPHRLRQLISRFP